MVMFKYNKDSVLHPINSVIKSLWCILSGNVKCSGRSCGKVFAFGLLHMCSLIVQTIENGICCSLLDTSKTLKSYLLLDSAKTLKIVFVGPNLTCHKHCKLYLLLLTWHFNNIENYICCSFLDTSKSLKMIFVAFYLTFGQH